MELSNIIKENRNEILSLSKLHGASNVRVFGSFARGEAKPDSDIDFLVFLEKGRSLLDLGGLLMDLQKLLGRKVDIVTEKGLHWHIKDQVLKEAKPI